MGGYYGWFWSPSRSPLNLTRWCHTSLFTKATVYSRLHLVKNNYRFIAVVKLLQEVPAFWRGGFLFWKEKNNLCESDGARGTELHTGRLKETWELGGRGLWPGSGEKEPIQSLSLDLIKSEETKQASCVRSWDLPSGYVLVNQRLPRAIALGEGTRARSGSVHT